MSSRPLLVAAAVRIYRAVLAIAPPQLRKVYGDDMRQTFESRIRDAAARGSGAVAATLCRETADLIAASLKRRRAARSTHDRTERRPAVSSFIQDVRYALRLMRREPTFAAVAVLTLALGVGATTAVFTVVSGVLLRPLPYADPDRIVQLLNGRGGRLSLSYSPPNLRDVAEQSGVFSAWTAITPSSSNLIGNGNPQQLDGAEVTPPFFHVLGIEPRLGRGFVADDGTSGAQPVVVISDALWRSQFGGRPDIVGTSIRLNGTPHTVVGVAPRELALPAGAEYWRPLIFSEDQLSDTQRGAQWVSALARLKDGVSLEQALAALGAVGDRLARDFPRTNKDRVMTGMRLHDRIVRNIRPALWLLLGAVMVVLLVACVNVANLLLARATGRTREVAVRAALGAGRSRLVQQFLVESLVLGCAGTAAGLFLSWGSVRGAVLLGPADIPRLAEIGIDWRVLAFAGAVALATSLFFGLLPAVMTAGVPVARFIGQGGRGSVGHRGTRLRKVLVSVEMALAVILLVAAGLLVRSYREISSVDPGFAPDHVLTFAVGLPETKYRTGPAVAQFVSEYVARLGSRPGVDGAAAIFGLPLDDSFSASSSFTKPGETDTGDSPSVGMRIITPEYFRTMHIPLKRGRAFDARDDANAPEVVIVNEEAARRYWPGEDPIGRQLHLGVRLTSQARSTMKTIVGVVGNVKFGGLDVTTPPEVYLPHAQHPVDQLSIALRAHGDPLDLVPLARAELASLDRELPLAQIRTMDEVVGRSIVQRRFMMTLLAAFAAIAVVLAAIGVYSVLAYMVGQRTQEIGVRLALGAAPQDVVRLFVREGVMLALVGLAAGLAGAVAAGRALTSLLFGVTPTDPTTFAVVAASLAFAALCASYLPARRAARVDPMEALRSE